MRVLWQLLAIPLRAVSQHQKNLPRSSRQSHKILATETARFYPCSTLCWPGVAVYVYCPVGQRFALG